MTRQAESGPVATRRQVLASAATTLAALYLPGFALAQDDEISAAIAKITSSGPFSRATVVEIARSLSKGEFVPPRQDLPDPIKDLSYEQYRDIRFDRDASIWAAEGLPFRLQLFHRGFYYKEEIDVALVTDGTAEHLAYSPTFFDAGKLVPQPLPADDIGFAGIRLLGLINDPTEIRRGRGFPRCQLFPLAGAKSGLRAFGAGACDQDGGPGRRGISHCSGRSGWRSPCPTARLSSSTPCSTAPAPPGPTAFPSGPISRP